MIYDIYDLYGWATMERMASEFGAKHAWLNPLQPWAGTSWRAAGGSGRRWGECQKRENKTCNIRFQSILIIFGYPWANFHVYMTCGLVDCSRDKAITSIATLGNPGGPLGHKLHRLKQCNSLPQSWLMDGQIIVGQPGQLPRCPDLLLDSSIF